MIVGGGYIGLEFGQMFRRFGSEVTMLVGSGIATREDADVSQLIADQLTDEGVDDPLHPAVPGHGAPTTACGSSSTTGDPVTGSHLLVATGRRSNSDLLGPDHGIETDDRGFFTIDNRFQTSVPGVWALGDVNGHGAFTHTAYQDGQILLDPDRSLDGRITAYAMFTDPPLGRVGMTVGGGPEVRPHGAQGRGADVERQPGDPGERDGRADADPGRRRQRGVPRRHHPRSARLTTWSSMIGLAMQAGVKYPAVQQALPIHPTMAEFIPSVLGSLEPLD